MNDVKVVGMVKSLERPLEGLSVTDSAGNEVGEAWRERNRGGRKRSELILHKERSRD